MRVGVNVAVGVRGAACVEVTVVVLTVVSVGLGSAAVVAVAITLSFIVVFSCCHVQTMRPAAVNSLALLPPDQCHFQCIGYRARRQQLQALDPEPAVLHDRGDQATLETELGRLVQALLDLTDAA